MQTEQKRQVSTTANSKKNVLFANNNLTYIQLGELQKSVNQLVHQNKSKYAKICESKVDFKYQLYKIGQFQAHSKAFSKELLMRQMDRLLEEKNYLDRELSLIHFHDQEEKNEKEQMVSSETEHFQLLKSIWKKEGNRNYEGTLDHIEELNLMVGQIKCNIQSLIKFQANDHKETNETYLNTFKILQDKNRECHKCNEMQAKNDHLKNKLTALEQRMNKITEENIGYLQQINAKEDKLKKINKNQIKQETELKDKIIRLEQQMLKKDQQIKAIKKEIHDLTENKFTNDSQGYDLMIKGAQLDLSRFHRKINISCETLLELITHEIHSQLRVSQPAKSKINSSRSKIDSTQGSSNSQPQLVKEHPNSYPEQELLLQNYSEKQQQERQRTSETKTGNQRYVRTSNKRSNRSGSIALNQQKGQGFLLGYKRGSQTYGTGTQ